jgi:tetratricopeptide (TPR) repeat protein
MIGIAAIFSLFLILGPAIYADAIGIQTGENAPDFTLRSTEHKTLSLSEHKEKVVMLIYWRADQERSLRALEAGKEVYQKYRQKGVDVIGLVADSEDLEKVKKIIEDKSIGFPVLIDSGRLVYGSYGIRVYPTTMLIDREGKLSLAIPGHFLTFRAMLEGNIRFLIGEIDKSQMEEALSPLKKVKDKSELEAERKYNLAMKFTESGLIDQAITAAHGAVEAKPEIAKSHLLLGFLYLEVREAEKAEESFNKVLELNPRSHDARTGLGGSLILKGDVDNAIAILQKAAEINPYPQMTYYELGRAYEIKGDLSKAKDMYKKALDKIVKKQILPSALSKCK